MTLFREFEESVLMQGVSKEFTSVILLKNEFHSR